MLPFRERRKILCLVEHDHCRFLMIDGLQSTNDIIETPTFGHEKALPSYEIIFSPAPSHFSDDVLCAVDRLLNPTPFKVRPGRALPYVAV